MYQYRIIIYEKNADLVSSQNYGEGGYIMKDTIFIGRTDKSYYIDYLKKYDRDTADEMKHINMHYSAKYATFSPISCNILQEQDKKKKALKKWWKDKLLWNHDNHFKNICDIKNFYSIEIRAGMEVVILASPLTL